VLACDISLHTTAREDIAAGAAFWDSRRPRKGLIHWLPWADLSEAAVRPPSINQCAGHITVPDELNRGPVISDPQASCRPTRSHSVARRAVEGAKRAPWAEDGTVQPKGAAQLCSAPCVGRDRPVKKLFRLTESGATCPPHDVPIVRRGCSPPSPACARQSTSDWQTANRRRGKRARRPLNEDGER
jgi:hypothetical protein